MPGTRLRRLWQIPGVHLLTSMKVVEEVRRNLTDRYEFLELRLLLQTVDVLDVPRHQASLELSVALHPKDVHVLAGAIDAQATHLLIGDKHFRLLYGQDVSGVLVLPPSEYLERYKA